MALRLTLRRHSALTLATVAVGVGAVVGWTALLLQVTVAVTRHDTIGRHDEASDRHTRRTTRLPEVDATTGPAPANATRVAAYGGSSLGGAGMTVPRMNDDPASEPFAVLHGILFRREPAPSALDALLRSTWDAYDRPAAPLLPQPREPRQ